MKKALLINVQNESVTEVEVIQDSKGSYLKSIYNHLGCDLLDIVNIGKDDVYVDDEGLMKITQDSKFFQLNPNWQPLAGNGLILGFDPETGESIDTTMTVEQVKEMVVFLDAATVYSIL